MPEPVDYRLVKIEGEEYRVLSASVEDRALGGTSGLVGLTGVALPRVRRSVREVSMRIEVPGPCHVLTMTVGPPVRVELDIGHRQLSFTGSVTSVRLEDCETASVKFELVDDAKETTKTASPRHFAAAAEPFELSHDVFRPGEEPTDLPEPRLPVTSNRFSVLKEDPEDEG